MRVGIVGNRDLKDTRPVREYVYGLDLDDIIVSGDGGNVDKEAAKAAEYYCRARFIFPAQWTRHGKPAGPKRNTLIVEHSDRIVAFWDGESSGTGDTVEKAERAGIPVTIIYPDGRREFRPGGTAPRQLSLLDANSPGEDEVKN